MKKKPVQMNMHDAKSHLSQLVKRAVGGEDVIIASGGKPQVKLVPVAAKAKRVLGSAAGQVRIKNGFDAFNAEIEKMFYGEYGR